jgi:hypothetical protein
VPVFVVDEAEGDGERATGLDGGVGGDEGGFDVGGSGGGACERGAHKGEERAGEQGEREGQAAERRHEEGVWRVESEAQPVRFVPGTDAARGKG